MDSILNSISEWFRSLLLDGIHWNFSGLFDAVNEQVGEIASQVGKTPTEWNAGVFSILRSLSNNVIVPVAGLILTFILTYELITMITEKNNFHDFDTFNIYKWIFKSFVAVYLVTHTFDITIAIFSMAQHIVQQSAGVIGSSASIDTAALMADLDAQLSAMGIGELLGLLMESMILRVTAPILCICIMLVLMGRMIEINIYCSVGAIPLATMTNREWGQMGQNYLRGLVALGLQGFFIMICVAIYSILVNQTISGNIHGAIWKCVGYTVLLCYSLFKTGSVSKSILNAH